MHWCWGHAVRPQRKGPNSGEWALRLTSHKLSWHTHDSSLSQAPSWKLKRSRFFVESKSWPKLTKADSAGSLRIPQRVYHHPWDKSGHPQLSLASASSHSQEPQHGNLMTTSWEAKLCGCAPNRFRSSTVQWMHFNCRVCRVCRGLWRLRHLQDALQSAFILRPPCCTFWRTSGQTGLKILCKASGLLVSSASCGFTAAICCTMGFSIDSLAQSVSRVPYLPWCSEFASELCGSRSPAKAQGCPGST